MTAYTASNPVPMSSLPTTDGVVQRFLVNATNTGNSTYAPDGLGAAPIFGLGGQQLQGAELVANGIATLTSYIGPLMNAGALCWILVDCAGGARQVALATQSQQAVQFGQIENLTSGGRLTRTTVYTLIDNVVNASVNGGPASLMPTFSTQPETTMWEVQGVGSGGGGGATAQNSEFTNSAGGAAGSFGWSIFTTAAVDVAVTIGAPGTGGTDDDSGGTVSLGSLLMLPGGLGGSANGGEGAGPTGANVMGFPGEEGGAISSISETNSLVMLPSGSGGSSKFGWGGQPAISAQPGQVGSGFGAGSSGAAGAFDGAAAANGTAGVLVIREYS